MFSQFFLTQNIKFTSKQNITSQTGGIEAFHVKVTKMVRDNSKNSRRPMSNFQPIKWEIIELSNSNFIRTNYFSRTFSHTRASFIWINNFCFYYRLVIKIFFTAINYNKFIQIMTCRRCSPKNISFETSFTYCESFQHVNRNFLAKKCFILSRLNWLRVVKSSGTNYQ